MTTKSIESVEQSMRNIFSNPPMFLRCLDMIGKGRIPIVHEIQIALCAMEILINNRLKVNFLSDAVALLSKSLCQIESSMDSLTLELRIANEELFDKMKIDWPNFCVEFIDYLCFAQRIPFAVPVAIQAVSNIAPLISSSQNSSIAKLWRSIPGISRAIESVSEPSKITNIGTMRRACIQSTLPIPLIKAYIILADS
jgi:hypothetical protein